jgi:hypothetical protein
MCVYCKESTACDHERDSCVASRGERCPECGHSSTAFLPYTPGRGRFNWHWSPQGQWPKRNALASQARPVAKKRAKK